MKTKVWHVFGLIGCLCLVGCGGNNIANYSEDEQVAIKQTTLQMTPDFSYTINENAIEITLDLKIDGLKEFETEFHTEENKKDLLGGYNTVIDKFASDRVMQKIEEFNQKA